MNKNKTIYINKKNKNVDDYASDRLVLYKCKSVRPFIFFPDSLIIDVKKVSIIHNMFFSRSIDTINIVDILRASAYHGMFFGSIQLTTRFFTQKSITFTHLLKKDAINARALIQGLIIAGEKKINLESMRKQEIVRVCMDLGKANI